MATYGLKHADGGVTDIVANNDTEAQRKAFRILADLGYDHAVMRIPWGKATADGSPTEVWGADGCDDNGQARERLLVWESEADAEDDSGASPIAELTVVRNKIDEKLFQAGYYDGHPGLSRTT